MLVLLIVDIAGAWCGGDVGMTREQGIQQMYSSQKHLATQPYTPMEILG